MNEGHTMTEEQVLREEVVRLKKQLDLLMPARIRDVVERVRGWHGGMLEVRTDSNYDYMVEGPAGKKVQVTICSGYATICLFYDETHAKTEHIESKSFPVDEFYKQIGEAISRGLEDV